MLEVAIPSASNDRRWAVQKRACPQMKSRDEIQDARLNPRAVGVSCPYLLIAKPDDLGFSNSTCCPISPTYIDAHPFQWFQNFNFISNIRLSGLSLTASLKAIQVSSTLMLYQSQCQAVTTRVLIQSALLRYIQGTSPLSNFSTIYVSLLANALGASKKIRLTRIGSVLSPIYRAPWVMETFWSKPLSILVSMWETILLPAAF